MKRLIEYEKVISGPALKWPAKEAQKMSARSVKISWRSVKTSHQWNQLFLKKKIPNSAHVIFASASLGSRRSDCGDGAKIRKNRERVGGGGGIAGSGRIFPEPGFDQNTVRHPGNVDGKRDLTASEEAGSDAGLGKKTMFGISFTEVRNAGFS